jgi:SAM-dependent methyltransferase
MVGLPWFSKPRTRVTYEPGIPPPEINYNQANSGNPEEYVLEFKRSACLRELPFLMRIAGLTPVSAVLDYGCGLGRIAYAASKYLAGEGAYYGYEPNQRALAFLKQAYADRQNFFFAGESLRVDEDYVAVTLGETPAGGTSAKDLDLTRFVDRSIDVQWSCSVFTHMWPDPIGAVLRNIVKVLGVRGLCVNTWLCVDEFAAYALRCGMADRQLPYRVNGALTYSQSNPLVCTAYELSAVRDIYARAGHLIEDILWGSWSGRDNGVIYQDIIISRPER